MKLPFFKPKAAKNDFTKSMLPQNRKEVFFDVVKLHWEELLSLGFILLLFSLPLLFSQIIQDYMTSSILKALSEAPTQEEIFTAYSNVAATENVRAFINIVLLLIYAVAFSGTVRVVRQYAWEQNVHVRTEFFKGVKQNIGQITLLAFIGGVIYALCVFAYNLATLSTGVISWLLFIPIAISLLVIFPIFCHTVTAICIYSNNMRQNLKIGFAVFAKTPFKTLLAIICCAVIYIPQCIPNFYCHVLGELFSALLTPFAILGWLLFSFNQLDKFVNKNLFPSIIGKGTFANIRDNDE